MYISYTYMNAAKQNYPDKRLFYKGYCFELHLTRHKSKVGNSRNRKGNLKQKIQNLRRILLRISRSIVTRAMAKKLNNC